MSEQVEKQPFWETLRLPSPGSEITREAFESLTEVPFHIEWHDGTVIYPNWNPATMSPSPSSRHQRIVVQLLGVLGKQLPNGDLLTAPMDLRMGGKIIQPDIFWVSEEDPCVDRGGYYEGPPSLVVEVLSPGNTENDRVTKFDLYQKTRVEEYWILNPVENYLEIYTLAGNTYRRLGAFKPGQTFRSPVLDVEIIVADVFQAGRS